MRFHGLKAFYATLLLCAQVFPQMRKPEWQAPPRAAQIINPLEERPELAAGGKKLFLRNCAQCHGTDALGRGKAVNLRDSALQSHSDGALYWKITNGNLSRGMPAWSGLPSLERWQLVLYLRKLNSDFSATKTISKAMP
jgi:mono/diheme cytochrome c family protein